MVVFYLNSSELFVPKGPSFIHENASENIVFELAAILSRGQSTIIIYKHRGLYKYCSTEQFTSKSKETVCNLDMFHVHPNTSLKISDTFNLR